MISEYKRITYIIAVLAVLYLVLIPGVAYGSCFLADSVRAGKDYSFHSHPEIIEMYKVLCDQNPEYSNYEPIGKTHLGNDIWAFKTGNPEGEKIIMDGCIHGWEDLGAEAGYFWMKWLLESNEPASKIFLSEICWIIIPVINFDSYLRGNANKVLCSGGVDLNRNFKQGWAYVDSCSGSFNTSHGAYPASEKETQVLLAFLEQYKPIPGKTSVYINTHFGGGPWIWYSGLNDTDFYLPVRERIINLWHSNNIAINNIPINQFLPPNSKKLPAPAGISGDAAELGYEPFTFEICNHNCKEGYRFIPANVSCTGEKGESTKPSPEVFRKQLYPIYKQVFIALSEQILIPDKIKPGELLYNEEK